MLRKVETFASIKNGILKITYKDRFLAAIAALPDSRGKLIYEKLYKKRSTYTLNEETGKQGRGQNGYYWFVIIGLFREGWYDLTGELIDQNQAHEKLKTYCNYREHVNEETGVITKLGLSTADQTTVEAEEYYQRCRQWIYEEMKITVPLPNEQQEIF